MPRPDILFISALLFHSNSLIADNGLYRGGNLREACRKQVAGRYLILQDEKNNSTAYINLLNKKQIRLKKNLKKYRKEHEEVAAKVRRIKFNMELIQKQEALASKLVLIEETMRSNSQILAGATKRLQEAKTGLSKYSARINTLFHIKPFKSESGGFHYEISYRSKCPPYRFSCPLSRKEAGKLLKLFTPDPAPVVCERYAKFLFW